MARRSSEHQLQAQVAAYLRLAMPPGTNCTSLDHSNTSQRHGAMLLARGVKSGVPDIHVTFRGLVHWIELKTAHNTLSAAQRAFRDAEIDAGAKYAVCRSVEQVEETLVEWRIPLRATVTGKAAA